MKFYDNLINDLNDYLSTYPVSKLPYSDSKIWSQDDHQKVILNKYTAYELDGYGFNVVTSKVIEDSVCVIGKDLNEIASDRKFSRICIIQLDDTEDEQIAYNIIRKVEYTKYHFFPSGYMMRISSQGHKEKVRVSSSAIGDGISFFDIGNLFIKKYKENKNVRAVKVIFITDTEIDYNEIKKFAETSSDITKALDHVMSSVNFDCDSCKLKPVCDEVEGMRELHFKGKMN